MARAAEARPLRRFLRLFWSWRATAVFLGVLAVAIAIPVTISALRGDLRSYRAELEPYVEGVRGNEPDEVLDHMCSSATRRFGDESELLRVIEAESARVGGIRSVRILRGEPRTAHLVVTSEEGRDRETRLPIAEERGELVPCPVGEQLLGAES